MVFRVLKDKKVTDGNIDLLSNVHQTDYDKVKLMDRIIIGDNTGYNLNLISYRYYGTEEHVDVLMKFNRIPSIFDIKENMPILIPEIESYREHTKLINIKPIVKQNKTELKPEDNLNSTKANTNKPSSTKTPYKGVVKKKNGVIIF